MLPPTSLSCASIQQQKKKKKRQQKISSADGGGGERVTSSFTFISSLTLCFLCERLYCSKAANELVRVACWSELDHTVPAGGPSPGEQEVHLEKQLERFEWQLRLLKGALTAGGNLEWAELLRHHADQEVCAVVLSFLEKVSAPLAGAGVGDGTGTL